jgi:hypothetical protein
VNLKSTSALCSGALKAIERPAPFAGMVNWEAGRKGESEARAARLRSLSSQRLRGSRCKPLPLLSLKQADKLPKAPYVVTDARCHLGRNAQALMDAAEIIVDKVYGKRGLVMIGAFGKSIGKHSR